MTKPTVNPFLKVLRQAVEENWCIQPYCTLCGARQFRFALFEVGGDWGGPLVNALSNVDLDELTSIPHWDDAIEIAVRDLPLPGQASALLEAWLERADGNIRFFDSVLYKLVRYLPEENSVRGQWIAKGIALAEKTRDFSLVESLMLTLRGKAVQHEQLMTLAKQLAVESKQMQRVLRNIYNRKRSRPDQATGEN
jgi:predicted nucleotidyltransferase